MKKSSGLAVCTFSAGSVEPETLEEEMTRPNGYLWKMSEISEVNNFLSKKAWIH